MGNYQVLFSGDVSRDVKEDTVRDNLAKILGIDERKARQLFSGRTVVVRSQMAHEEALDLQTRFAEFGAICRVKDLTPQPANESNFKIDRHAREPVEGTLRDITAAHIECPRCGHLQLEASHCARCGIDISAALKQKRKEDLIIEKKIRELRANKALAPSRKIRFDPADAPQSAKEHKKRGKMMSWLRKSG